jgi:hypothetical protein
VVAGKRNRQAFDGLSPRLDQPTYPQFPLEVGGAAQLHAAFFERTPPADQKLTQGRRIFYPPTFPLSIIRVTLKQHVARRAATAYLTHLDNPMFCSSSALEALEVVLIISLALATGILIARFFKNGLVMAIGAGIGLSILEAFFNPTLALALIGMAVLAFFVYVASRVDWKDAFIPVSHQQALKNREEQLNGPQKVSLLRSQLTKLQQSE